MVPILMNKDVFELSYNDLKFTLKPQLLLHQPSSRSHFKTILFFICGQLMRHSLIELLHLSNMLQMPNYCRTSHTEFLVNFLCSCKRISFYDCSQLVSVTF